MLADPAVKSHQCTCILAHNFLKSVQPKKVRGNGSITKSGMENKKKSIKTFSPVKTNENGPLLLEPWSSFRVGSFLGPIWYRVSPKVSYDNLATVTYF